MVTVTLILLGLVCLPSIIIQTQAYLNAKTYKFAVQDDLLAITQLMDDMKYLTMRKKPCKPTDFGELYGAHKLCPLFVHENFHCHFLSFGIEKDYSFDIALQKQLNCSGVAFDPTVDLPENLAPGIRFLKQGANSPHTTVNGTFISIPKYRQEYGHPLYALKMDCEGCEYSLAEDILRDDPNFFLAVLQLNIEIHLPRTFASTDQDVYNMGRLLRLIYLSGMKLIHVDSGQCGPKDQALGCHDLLQRVNFPCDPGCRSFLFTHNYLNLHTWKEVYHRMNA